MNRFSYLTLLFLVLGSTAAFGDHLNLLPNSGFGDNFGYLTEISGHPVYLSGGTGPFTFDSLYAPGATLGDPGDLYLSSTVIWVDNTPEEFFFPGAGLIYITSLTMQPITLPTDGRESFSVFVNIDFFHSGYNFDTGQTIDVSGGARGTVSFFLTPSGFYENEGFVEAPEPGTLALVGTGLVSVVALARRRLRT